MEPRKAILVVLEDSKLTQLVLNCLTNNHFVTHVHRVDKAFSMLDEKHFDLVILHTKNCYGDTVELCTRAKLETDAKVIFLSNCENIQLKERCFESGADDYILMPFYPKELTLRVCRLLNEYDQKKNLLFEYRGLLLNSSSKSIKFNNCTVFLSPTEFLLMEYMIRQVKLHKAEGLINYISLCKNRELSHTAILVLIKRLRTKLIKGIGMEIIKTRYGLGYYISI